MIKIASIYDIFSLIPLLIDVYILISFNVKLLLLLWLSLFIHYQLKDYTSGLYPNIFKRPDGANNCDICNKGGNVSMKSGFPSGHMTTISLFTNYLLLKKEKITFKDIVLYNIPCVLVGIGRYYKKCHNIIQIVSGYLLGLGIAFADKKITLYLKKNNFIKSFLKKYI